MTPRISCITLLLFAVPNLCSFGSEANVPTASASTSPELPVNQVDISLASLRFENTTGQETIRLVGRDSSAQLIVTASLANGELRDFTRQVHYTMEPATRVRIDGDAVVTPLTDGAVTITAHDSVSGKTAAAIVEVAGSDVDTSISFPGQIVPLFTKLGCNGGGCHGKLSGQNGF